MPAGAGFRGLQGRDLSRTNGSSLNTQPALRAEIEALRDHAPARTDAVPARQRATEASLRQLLESLRAENQRLRGDNQQLRAELAIAYGQQRCTARR